MLQLIVHLQAAQSLHINTMNKGYMERESRSVVCSLKPWSMKVEFIKAPVQGQSDTGTIMLIVGIKMRNLLLLYNKVKIKLRKIKKIKSLLFHFYSFFDCKTIQWVITEKMQSCFTLCFLPLGQLHILFQTISSSIYANERK